MHFFEGNWMSGSRLIGIIAAIIVLFIVVHFARDPHRTALPFGSTDLASVESALRRLPAGERTLVESYVKRSNGDVLPARFADPDNPLTARTFGEAIALEKRWQEKMRAQQIVQDDLAAKRDAALAPLRDAVTASVARAEVITRDEFDARQQLPARQPLDSSGAKIGHRADSSGVFVVTVAIENHTDADIVKLQGSLEAKDRDKYLALQLCWIDLNEQRVIPAHSRTDIVCGNRNFNAGADQNDFVTDPPGRFTVVWTPKQVKLSNGKVLESNL
jgi:hypothetical protein